MDKIDLKNPVMAVAVLSQRIAELEKNGAANAGKANAGAANAGAVNVGAVNAGAVNAGAVNAGAAELGDAAKAELSECLQQRGGLLMAMGDKQGAEADMKRYLELNPEKVGELNGEFKAEGKEHCR